MSNSKQSKDGSSVDLGSTTRHEARADPVRPTAPAPVVPGTEDLKQRMYHLLGAERERSMVKLYQNMKLSEMDRRLAAIERRLF